MVAGIQLTVKYLEVMKIKTIVEVFWEI